MDKLLFLSFALYTWPSLHHLLYARHGNTDCVVGMFSGLQASHDGTATCYAQLLSR